jgi:hypothetical protein
MAHGSDWEADAAQGGGVCERRGRWPPHLADSARRAQAKRAKTDTQSARIKQLFTIRTYLLTKGYKLTKRVLCVLKVPRETVAACVGASSTM